MSLTEVYQQVIETLKTFALKEEYSDEEKDLQPHIENELKSVLDKFEPNRYTIKRSLGGINRPHIDLLGTNWWIDIEILYDGNPVIAIEVKYQKGLSGAISAALGQCLIYKLKYDHVIGFILHKGPRNPTLNEYDKPFDLKIKELGIPIIIRS